MNAEAKEKALRRVRALRAKTLENGATEAEALAAFELAERIAQEHGLDEQDIKETVYVINEVTGMNRRACHNAWEGIQWFTRTVIYFDAGTIKVTGRPHEAEMAAYLFDVIDNVVTAETRRWAAAQDVAPMMRVRNAFATGMVLRLNDRLKEMARARAGAATAYGARLGEGSTAMVVTNEKAIKAWLRAEHGVRLHKVSSSEFGSRGGQDARDQGKAAGDRVNLNPGIGGGGKGPRLLGA